MNNSHKEHISQNGFTTIPDVFSEEEIKAILDKIEEVDSSKDTFRKSEDLFAIRQFLKEIPGVSKLIFTPKLKEIIEQLFGEGYFAVKSIYFDKP